MCHIKMEAQGVTTITYPETIIGTYTFIVLILVTFGN
jgi:hypothetical protein